jgi:hypothetical protein
VSAQTVVDVRPDGRDIGVDFEASRWTTAQHRKIDVVATHHELLHARIVYQRNQKTRAQHSHVVLDPGLILLLLLLLLLTITGDDKVARAATHLVAVAHKGDFAFVATLHQRVLCEARLVELERIAAVLHHTHHVALHIVEQLGERPFL